MTLKEIKSDTVFGTTVSQPERSNDGKGLPRNSQNFEEALIL